MGKKVTDIVEHFFSKVNKDGENGCWLWTGCMAAAGYGRFHVNRKPVYAHRWSYEYLKGEVPKGLYLDHLCRVRRCVNPDHLEVVTHQVNTLRGISPVAINAQKTHCIKGHPLTEDNIYVYKKRREGRWMRVCRTCKYAQVKKYKAKMRGRNHKSWNCPF